MDDVPSGAPDAPRGAVSAPPEDGSRTPRFLGTDRITTRIVLLTVGATILPILAAGILAFLQTRRAVVERVDGDLQSVARLTARELDYWLRRQTYEIGVFASSAQVSLNLARVDVRGPGAQEARARLAAYLTSVAARMDEYAELMILDADGHLVASSDSGRETLPGHPAFNGAGPGAGTELGHPFAEPGGGDALAPLFEPIPAPAGAGRLGTLVALLDLGGLGEILGAFQRGNGTSVRLLHRDGMSLARSVEADAGPPLAGGVLETLADGPGTVVQFDAMAGEPRLGVLETVPRSDWVVTADIARAVAYAPLRRVGTLTLVAVGGLVLLVGGIVHLLGMILVRPLDRLTAGAARVAAGDLAVDLPPAGRGEVGYLTDVFNEMVRRLRAGREELDRANRELLERNAELAHLSVTDGLTGLANHRRGMEILAEELQRSGRTAEPVALLMIDVDHFKRYNDTWGHPEGDAVLRGVARALQQATRGVDGVVRYGGEEFMIVLPTCDAEGALEAGSRILERLAREAFVGGPVTLSCGVAVYPRHATEVADLVRIADEALYTAKRNGRNRVVLAPGVELPRGSRCRTEVVGAAHAAPIR